jgi:hypothetical protein
VHKILAISKHARVALEHGSLDAIFLLQTFGERVRGFSIAGVVNSDV